MVSGGTGSGKTTTLNALSGFIAADERVVTIEDTAELRLQQPHVVRLEARPANVEGRGEVTVRRLVRNALRMRPDRIIVGEVRGGEALDMLGGDVERPRRLAVDCSRWKSGGGAAPAGDACPDGRVGLPHAAIREQLASAIDLIVHQARTAEGLRRIVAVSEVVRVADGSGDAGALQGSRRSPALARGRWRIRRRRPFTGGADRLARAARAEPR